MNYHKFTKTFLHRTETTLFLISQCRTSNLNSPITRVYGLRGSPTLPGGQQVLLPGHRQAVPGGVGGRWLDVLGVGLGGHGILLQADHGHSGVSPRMAGGVVGGGRGPGDSLVARGIDLGFVTGVDVMVGL